MHRSFYVTPFLHLGRCGVDGKAQPYLRVNTPLILHSLAQLVLM